MYHVRVKCLLLLSYSNLSVSRDSSAGIATRLPAGRPRSRGSIPGRGKKLQNVQNSSEIQPAFDTMGTAGCFTGDKAAGA
jgi:hypothetical protein